MRQLREAEMSPAVAAWLESLGCDVYTEVPHYGRAIDVVGVCWPTERVIAVEMKTSLTHGVIRQASRVQVQTPWAYAAVASKPKASGILRASQLGIGVLQVCGGSCRVLLEPQVGKCKPFAPQKLIDLLRQLPKGGVGGKPCLKGEGPAQDVDRAIAEYRAEHPKATWQEVFENVPNHYAHARSMAGAMGKLRCRRHWQERRNP